MNPSDDGQETLERLLGAGLAALLEELDAVERDIDALPADEGASARNRRAELEERRRHLRTGTLDEFLSARRRLRHGVPPRDERTMPLPFVDLGVH